MIRTPTLPDWEDVLSAASRRQKILPDAVLVGGTAVALHAHHRRSYDADHVIPDLRSHFADVLQTLEEVAGWKTARINKPVQILGSLDGIDTGIRQLIRAAPLKTRSLDTPQGRIRVPTKLEALRIKGALILKRNATRDYVDFIALADKLGKGRSAAAMLGFDELYPQPNAQSAIKQLISQLTDLKPYDRDDTDLSTYRGLEDRYAEWGRLSHLGSHVAQGLMDSLLERREGNTGP